MTTVKRKKTKRPQLVTTFLPEVRRAMSEGKDVVLVSGTLKRPEVRVRHNGLNRVHEIDRFGFLAYRPSDHSVWYHVFVDGEYIGVERNKFNAAMVEAMTYASFAYTDPESIKHRARVVCEVLRIGNV